MNEPFTVVYRGLTSEQRSLITLDPKAVWFGHCHAPHERDEARAAFAAQPGSVGEWKRVPVEPTPAMLVAMWDHRESMRGQSENRIARAGYAAMLAAAPTEAKPAQDAVDAEPLDDEDLATLEQIDQDFEDAEETTVDYDVLMRFARMGYLECTHFTVTSTGRAAISAKKGQS